ncbi:MAG TPA: LLM class flavin-dependent oxidoreductase [Acidimicrobiia bacterium]|jgi:alkanesulfonate monooxygenase SsuD/methylene tetrahydromethanopterin reductase-like flavin-dependent oxidoreductase (luciferase family)
MTLRLGLTLPSFTRSLDAPLAIASAADDAGLDSVFAYDHMFRIGSDGRQRPAVECFALLAAVARETHRVAIGSLVIRTSLRPAAVVVAAVRTLDQQAPGRLLIGLGAGDHESRPEHEQFGIPFPPLARRIELLRATRDALAAGAPEVPVWIGGRHHLVRSSIDESCAAWNVWGARVIDFASEGRDVRGRAPSTELTWGGLVVLGATDESARTRAESLGAPPAAITGAPATVARQLRPYVDAGATTLVLGPVDSSNLDNVALAAEVRALLQE